MDAVDFDPWAEVAHFDLAVFVTRYEELFAALLSQKNRRKSSS